MRQVLVRVALRIVAAWCVVTAASAGDIASMNQPEIVALQRRLVDGGCYTGPLDGAASAATAAAIKACPDQEPVLRIETGMHVTIFKRISVNAACTLVATASEDKTVRLWSLPDGRLVRTLRVPIAAGDGGKVYATAVSPDGRFVAAGGWDARYDVAGDHSIYVFEAQSGRMVARIGGMRNVINRLTFSPDGRWLAANLEGTAGLHVINVSTWREIMQDTAYAFATYGASFAPDGRLATVAYDGHLRLYGPGPAFGKLADVTTRGGKQPYSVAFDPTGSKLVVGYFDTTAVDVYDGRTLHFLQAAQTAGVDNGNLLAVAWLADGSRILAGGQYGDKGRKTILSFSPAGARLGVASNLARDTVFDIQPCGQGYATASGDPALGLFGPRDETRFWTTGVSADLRAMGAGFAVSADAKRVRFGLKVFAADAVTFDLDRGTVASAPRVPTGLAGPRSEGLPVANWEDQTAPTFAGKPIALRRYEETRSLAVLSDGFVLGADFSLRSFDAKGIQRWERSVPGSAWGVNRSADGRIVVAAYGDGSIRWHRWSDGAELLALFVNTKTKAWVAWTPTGYYAASPDGEDMIGWHVNRGWDQAADFFPAAKFRDRFARPDIIARVLDTLDESEAVRLANLAAHKREDSSALIARLPPVLRITSPAAGASFVDSDVAIGYAVRSPSGLPVDRIDVLIDGVRQQDRGFDRLAGGAAPGPGETVGTVSVRPPPRDVEVALVPRSGDLSGEPTKLKLAYAGGAPHGAELLKPKLYALVVGISAYADPTLTLGYAAKDARDFASMLQAQKGGLYGDVEVRAVLDGAATRAALIRGLKWLETQVTSRDVGMVFLAGHGDVDTGQTFWFLPADATPGDLDTSAVSQDDIRRTLNKLAGKAILFLDACHAGQVSKAGFRGALDINKTVGDFAQTDNGVVVFAASTGREVSQERDDWGNGAFTKAVIEGLGQGQADFLHNGAITLSELDAYVTDRVKTLTAGLQHPTMKRPDTVPDYPIATFRR